MLEYMLLRPIESKIWADTQNWLNADSNNKLLFVIDEAHMYRGSAGGEVSFLIGGCSIALALIAAEFNSF